MVAPVHVAAGHKFLAATAVGHASDLNRCDGFPLLGQMFVVGERDADVDLVGLGEPIGRAEIGEPVVGVAPVLRGNTRMIRGVVMLML